MNSSYPRISSILLTRERNPPPLSGKSYHCIYTLCALPAHRPISLQIGPLKRLTQAEKTKFEAHRRPIFFKPQIEGSSCNIHFYNSLSFTITVVLSILTYFFVICLILGSENQISLGSSSVFKHFFWPFLPPFLSAEGTLFTSERTSGPYFKGMVSYNITYW